MKDHPVREFGRYTLVRRIGSGGMAEIWKAKAVGPSGFVKHFALKMILPEIADDATFVSMFIDEAKLVASLVHPNIVQVIDFGQIEGRYFIAMEYVAGSDLRRLLDRVKAEGGRLSPELAAYVALSAARGLGFAHGRVDAAGAPLGLVHRDISPQNLLVSATGEVKVGDFGIARVAGAGSRTLQGHVRGKVAYMSPEQLQAPASLDARTDLFALGAILHEMLSGHRLFPGRSTEELYRQIVEFRPESLDGSGVPGALREALVGALQPDRLRRTASAAVLEARLGEFLGVAGMARAQQELGALVGRLFEAEIREHVADEVGVTGETNAAEAATASGTWALPGGTSSATLKLPGQPVSEEPPRPGRGGRVRLRTLGLALAGVAGLLLLTRLWGGWGAGDGGNAGRSVGALRGGTLRVAIGYDSAPTFDLFALPATRNRSALHQVTEPLFRQSRTGETVPWLVERASIEDGGKRVRLSLRHGVFFHDHPCFPDGKGREAAGRDLAYSLREAIRAGRTPLPIRGVDAFRAGRAAEIAGLTSDAAGVTLEFDAPAPFYVAEVAEVRLVPAELAGCEDLSRLRQPVGTGPFRFAAPQSPTGALQLARAERYWRRDDAGGPLPYLDALELQSIADLADGLARVGHDELDVLAPQRADWSTIFDSTDARVTLAPRYRALPGVDAAVYSSRSRVALFGLVPSAAEGPLRDPRIRRAIGLAIDRPALLDASPRPGYVPAFRFFDPRMLGYDHAVAGLGHDPDEAARLLERAGHPRGAGLRPLKIGTVTETQVADLLRRQLAPLGLKLETVLLPGSELAASVEAATVDAILASNDWSMLDGEPSTIAREVQILPPSAATLALLHRLAATPERTDRIPVHREIERVLLEELPMIPIAAGDGTQPVNLFVVHRRVQHFHDPVTGATTSEAFDFSETWLDRAPGRAP